MTDDDDTRLVLIPIELLAELEAEAALMLKDYRAGRIDLPAEYREQVPLHYVIQLALEDLERS